MSEVLKNCPLCKEEVEVYAVVPNSFAYRRDNRKVYFVMHRCSVLREREVLSKDFDTEEEAIANWNKCVDVKHGNIVWFEDECGTPIDGYDYNWGWKCSECGYVFDDKYDDQTSPPELNFCPMCGVKFVIGIKEIGLDYRCTFEPCSNDVIAYQIKTYDNSDNKLVSNSGLIKYKMST